MVDVGKNSSSLIKNRTLYSWYMHKNKVYENVSNGKTEWQTL